MPEIKLSANGKEFGGWTTARVTRGIESLSGGFELTASDRWAGQDQPWAIFEEDECVLKIDDTVLITGYVDRRSISLSSSEHSLSYSGRDRAAALVDCSVLTQQWEFWNTAPLTLIEHVTKPFKISVKLAPGTPKPPPIQKLSIDPGDSAHDAIEKVLRKSALLAWSDGVGGLIVGRPGSNQATTALVEGQNILTASADFGGEDLRHPLI